MQIRRISRAFGSDRAYIVDIVRLLFNGEGGMIRWRNEVTGRFT